MSLIDTMTFFSLNMLKQIPHIRGRFGLLKERLTMLSLTENWESMLCKSKVCIIRKHIVDVFISPSGLKTKRNIDAFYIM